MPARRRIPSYSLHQPSGQARVILGGRHVYLGRYGTPDSLEAFQRLITEHLSGSAPVAVAAPRPQPADGISVGELILRYGQFVLRHHVRDGKPTDEQYGIRAALRYVRRLWGHSPAA